MQSEAKRFADRFQTLFSEGGLKNIKFFVEGNQACTLALFRDEVNRIQETISAGDVRVVDSIDGGFETRRFDDAF